MEDRDMLIKVEQKLENARDNQVQIIKDLRDIFSRLEYNSKVAVTLTIDLKGHIARSDLVWKNHQKENAEIERRLVDIEHKFEDINKEIIAEREERTKSVTIEREKRMKEIQSRETFEQEIRSGIRLTGWIFGILASIATLVSAVTAVAVFILK